MSEEEVVISKQGSDFKNIISCEKKRRFLLFQLCFSHHFISVLYRNPDPDPHNCLCVHSLCLYACMQSLCCQCPLLLYPVLVEAIDILGQIAYGRLHNKYWERFHLKTDLQVQEKGCFCVHISIQYSSKYAHTVQMYSGCTLFTFSIGTVVWFVRDL